MKKMKGPGFAQTAFDTVNVFFMILLGVIMIYPIWHVICASLSSVDALMRNRGILLWPVDFNFKAYSLMWTNPMISKSYINTIIIVASSVSVSMCLTVLCAYVLSRKNVFWNPIFNSMVMITMFFGGGLIPTYLLVAKNLNLNNNYLALILPNAVNVFNMIIMKTSFLSVPESLEESAKLDGAGHWRILFNIILPLSKSILAVITLYYAVSQWNSWFEAAIYLQDRERYPLQLILREILINNDTALMSNASALDGEAVGDSIKYAVIVFATLPILCVYPYLQKYFTKGVMIGAMKE